MTETERTEALVLLASLLQRCERMQLRFAPGVPQHTLLKNRLQALKIARSLLISGNADQHSDQLLEAAAEPIASVIRKCEKARSKYDPASGQFRRYDGILRVMKLSGKLIAEELQARHTA